MKKGIVAMGLLILLSGCASDLKLLALNPGVGRGGRVDRYAILPLLPSAYLSIHTIPAVQEINFPSLSVKFLEESITRERKNWKAAYPAVSAGADSAVRTLMAARKDDPKAVTEAEKAAMKKLAGALETRYFFILESATVKDVSSAQVPKSLVVGVCLQMWDFQTGEMVYRAREASRIVGYFDEKFRKLLDEALLDLFGELISPLAVN